MKKVDYMSADQIAMWVIKHNPQDSSLHYNALLEPVIKTRISIDNLQLPPGCYYNSKNGITNKHNTTTGMYATLKVEY